MVDFFSTFLSFKMKLRTIPKIIETAIEVILITGLLTSPKVNVNPPIPATKITEATKMFLVLEKSTFSLTNILTPEEAMKPYKIKETPPVTQNGMVCKRAVNGVKKPNKIVMIAAKIITLIEAIFVIPITATFSP